MQQQVVQAIKKKPLVKQKRLLKTEATSGASANGYTDPSELKDSYDVVIVGSGGAGMTAALQAKEAGMNPVILEKCLLQVGIQLNRLQE